MVAGRRPASPVNGARKQPRPNGATPRAQPNRRCRAATRTTSTAATTATSSAPSPAPSTPRASSSRTPARTRGRSCSDASPSVPRSSAGSCVVATREAFRLSDRERRHLRLEATLPDGAWEAVIADEFSIDDVVEAREALEILATLPERQRADLTLQVAGFSYKRDRRADRRAHATPTSTSTSRRPARASGSRDSAEPPAHASRIAPQTDR